LRLRRELEIGDAALIGGEGNFEVIGTGHLISPQ
jgi:hypothetical protein